MNDDVLVEILARLPPSSFSRSKCVSTHWQSLLSDNGHVRSKLPLLISGVFQGGGGGGGPLYVQLEPPPSISTSSSSPNASSTLIDCSNGLLLFYSSASKAFHVSNATTNKCVELPKPRKETKLSILAFDPYYSKHFKVVNFTAWREHGVGVEVFDSEAFVWTSHSVVWESSSVRTDALSATMRYVAGVLYVLAQPKHCVAISLDKAGIECKVVELPESMQIGCCVGVLNGRLSYCCCVGGKQKQKQKQMRVWVMDDNDMQWSLRHCVEMNNDDVRVLGLNPEREVVYLCEEEERLVGYDVERGRVERVWELGEEEGYLVQVWVFPFTRHVEDCLKGFFT